MLEVRLLDWQSAQAEAKRVRFVVFVEEQGVPADLEMDDMDAKCIHALAYGDGRVVATGRLLPDGHIGRMAVVKDWRRRGVGAELLDALLAEARRRGLAEVRLTAPLQALEFYRSQGFVADGKVQQVEGVLQQAMRKPLAG